MPIEFRVPNPPDGKVTGPEKMFSAITEAGIIPFFACEIPGYSIEEMTPPQCWFTEENLGPWDWKIDCIRSGELAYGKYLRGKAAFATTEWFAHVMNYRRSMPKYRPEGMQAKALEAIRENGSLSSRELRRICGLPKGKMDAVMTRLQMSTLVVIGDIERVFRGPDLRYNGWQLSSFCTPEDLFADEGLPFPGARKKRVLLPSCTPEESFETLRAHILEMFPGTPDKPIERLLG